VALVEVDAVDDPLDGLVESGIVEEDVRGLAAELERQLLPRARDAPLDRLAHLGRAGERDLVDVAVDERGAGAAVARDDVDDARRKLRLPQHVGEEERGERRRLRGLEDDRVPGGERRSDLPREHEQREVPRNDLPGHPDGPRPAVRECVLELVRPARVIEEVRRGERQVDVARLLDRLPAVQRLEHGELAGALREDARDPEQVLRALRRIEPRPVRERLARGGDGPRDVLGPCLADLGERRLVARRDGREVLLRGHPLAADEEAVAVLELDDVGALGRGRVHPAARHRRAVGPLLDVGRLLSHS
jgi:hypothetical protein